MTERSEKKNAARRVKQKKRKKPAPVRGRLPSKRSVNLAVPRKKPFPWLLVLLSLLLIAAAAAAVWKFGVTDRWEAQRALSREVAELEARTAEMRDAVASYGDIAGTYARYTNDGMTVEELSLADRVAVMELIERVVMDRASVDSWTLAGNELRLSFRNATLEAANQIAQALLAEELVEFCAVEAAAKDGGGDVPRGERVGVELVAQLRGRR